MVEVCVGVRSHARTEEILALPRSQEGYVLDEVRDALLFLGFVDGSGVHLEMGFEALGGSRVAEDDVAEAIGEISDF